MIDLGQRWIEAMRAERYEDAWVISEAVLRGRDPTTHDDPTEPFHRRWVWDGRPLDGRDVLVRCYNGLGDTLQFARFLPILARRARSVTIEAPPRLLPLLATVARTAALMPFDRDRPLPEAECEVEITELAFALRTSPEGALPPYLSAAPDPAAAGAIALCYGCGDWDADRSIPPALFARLCRERACLTLVPEPTTLQVRNPAGCPFDMAATAALVAGAALVITVDTMIAHLAGALGRPTWLLLKAEPDWRWNPRATTTPWYPGMRLFVQRTRGDWAGVLAEVERALGIA